MLHWFETLKINVRFMVRVPQRQGKCINVSAEADEAAAIGFLILLIAPLAERTLQLQILWTLRKILQGTSSQNNTIKSTEWWYMTEGWKSSAAIYFHFIFISSVSCVVSLFLSLTASCCGFFPFTEAVRLSDPGLHQALHRPQLATEARQGSLGQRPPGERGQGTNSQLIVFVFFNTSDI